MTRHDDRPDNETAKPVANAEADRKQTMKERARQYRRDTYQRLKAANKATRAALASSPAALERKQQQKEMRREVYLKAKASRTNKKTAKKVLERELSGEERQQRDQELMKSLKPAAALDEAPHAEGLPSGVAEAPAPRRLRLVRNDD